MISGLLKSTQHDVDALGMGGVLSCLGNCDGWSLCTLIVLAPFKYYPSAIGWIHTRNWLTNFWSFCRRHMRNWEGERWITHKTQGWESAPPLCIEVERRGAFMSQQYSCGGKAGPTSSLLTHDALSSRESPSNFLTAHSEGLWDQLSFAFNFLRPLT